MGWGDFLNPLQITDDIFGGKTQEDLVKETNRTSLNQADRADKRLKALDGIQEQFLGLGQLMGPTLQSIFAGNAMIGRNAATGIQAGLNRAGFGNTGLGSVLGQGALAGANFQNNQLRARMMQDLLGSAIQTNTARGSFMAGIPIQTPSMSSGTEYMQRAGSVLQILGAMSGGGAAAAAAPRPVN